MYYLAAGLTDSAELVFRKLLHRSVGYNERHAAFSGLAAKFQKTGPLDSLSKYAVLSEQYNDSLFLQRYRADLLRSQQMFNYTRYIKASEKSALESKRKSKIISFSIIAFLLVLFAFIVFYFYSKIRRKELLMEYKEKMRDWPLAKQATAYRGMVFAQTQEENVLMGVSSIKGINGLILSKESDQERLGVASYINALASRVVTATVSYVGKANYREAEQYIRDFRTWTASPANGLTIEISAVNGRFTLDFLQTFSSPIFVNAFLKELEENGIVYDLQDVNELELPNIILPWTK